MQVTGFKFGRGWDIEIPYDTEMKPRICGSADSECAYNKSHLH